MWGKAPLLVARVTWPFCFPSYLCAASPPCPAGAGTQRRAPLSTCCAPHTALDECSCFLTVSIPASPLRNQSGRPVGVSPAPNLWSPPRVPPPVLSPPGTVGSHDVLEAQARTHHSPILQCSPHAQGLHLLPMHVGAPASPQHRPAPSSVLLGEQLPYAGSLRKCPPATGDLAAGVPLSCAQQSPHWDVGTPTWPSGTVHWGRSSGCSAWALGDERV